MWSSPGNRQIPEAEDAHGEEDFFPIPALITAESGPYHSLKYQTPEIFKFKNQAKEESWQDQPYLNHPNQILT